MRAFDLKAAKAGACLFTRDGRRATLIAHRPHAKYKAERLLVMVDGVPKPYREDGLYHAGLRRESKFDLFTAAEVEVYALAA